MLSRKNVENDHDSLFDSKLDGGFKSITSFTSSCVGLVSDLKHNLIGRFFYRSSGIIRFSFISL